MNDAKHRKFLLTINESDLFGPDHESIKIRLSDIDIIDFWCMCDEVDRSTEIYHTHVFIVLAIPVSGSYIMKKFPEAHVEYTLASPMECIDYVRKQGRYHEINLDYSFNLINTYEDSFTCSVNEDHDQLISGKGWISWVTGIIQKLHTMIKRKK